MKQFKDFKNLSIATLMAAALFTACSNDDNSIVDKPTLGRTVTWNINTQGNAIVGAGEYWIIKGTGEQANNSIIIGDGATVVLSGVNIKAKNGEDASAGITCLGDATIVLETGTENIVMGASYYPGITVSTENKIGTLTIKGVGSLEAQSSFWAPGIGCPYYDNNESSGVKMDCGNIVIENGNITAYGSGYSAAIGSSGPNKCGDITIKGGNVTATSVDSGPGIGCSGFENGSSCGNITVLGGVVNAKGSDNAPAIGCGFKKGTSCGDILIDGGVVNADTGDSDYGPGIGSIGEGVCGSITITYKVTKVTSLAGKDAPFSIGLDHDTPGHCGPITIGGTVYWDGNEFLNGGRDYLAQKPFVYEP